MIVKRDANQRGMSRFDWLLSYHSFSFADYFDREWMGFGFLRVINDDYIAPDTGFGMHAHRDMEIITYIVHGELAHKDSMGNGSVIKPGEIQRMSAGSGVQHSEFNNSPDKELRLLQIWLLPDQEGIEPGYEQKSIAKKDNEFILIAGPDLSDAHSVKIHQKAWLYAIYCQQGADMERTLVHQRCWLQVVNGKVKCNDIELIQGDGLGLLDEDRLHLQCLEDAELLFFEMA